MAERSAPGGGASLSGRVLIIAGSDSGAGAGIQADIKTVMALGGYATTAITAVTAQNTVGVRDVALLPAAMVGAQIDAVTEDIGADAVKTGMLGSAEIAALVAERVGRLGKPVVVDPVMVATSGDALLARDAVEVVRARLAPLATVLTPNVPEAELLLGREIGSRAAQREAALDLRRTGAMFVLVKGGHLPGSSMVDVLAGPEGVTELVSPRIETRHTHGTGCTLASAIAVGLAAGMGVPEAVARARQYLRAAMLAAPGLGQGHGPLQHAVMGGE